MLNYELISKSCHQLYPSIARDCTYCTGCYSICVIWKFTLLTGLKHLMQMRYRKNFFWKIIYLFGTVNIFFFFLWKILYLRYRKNFFEKILYLLYFFCYSIISNCARCLTISQLILWSCSQVIGILCSRAEVQK